MANWQNRIVGYDSVDPAELLKLANPMNPRRHPEFQEQAVEGSLNEVGWVQDVVVNKTTGKMLDGHLRVKSAVKTGQESIPVKYVELTEAEEALVLATLDYTTNLAEFDDDIMKSLLSQLDTDEPGLMAMLDEMRDEFGVNGAGGEGEGTDTEPQVDKAEELRVKWGVELGQLWQLGDHRLICGDCTDPAVVARVMGGERAELCVTDPPYMVNYNPQWRVGVAGGGKQEFANGKVIHNDDNLTWLKTFENLPADVLYCWTAGATVKTLQTELELNGFLFAYLIIWNKDLAVFGRGDYHHKHEPCLYMVRKGSTHNWQGDRKQETVWDIPTIHSFANGHNSEEWGLVGHGNQKPVECMARPIKNNSASGQIIYEPFSGSGTTIIACENLKRRCRAIEIDPGYVAVTLERYYQHSGILPELIS